MARYITELANDIAKSCPDLVENGCGNDNCVACLAFKLIGLGYKKQPNTADVVPKNEVASIFDELIKEASEIAEYYKKEADGMSCSEYAKIEYRGTQIGALLVQYKIAELKKKHTESEGER